MYCESSSLEVFHFSSASGIYKEKIVDKTDFNERTRSALMKVAYLASLELRVESLGLNLEAPRVQTIRARR